MILGLSDRARANSAENHREAIARDSFPTHPGPGEKADGAGRLASERRATEGGTTVPHDARPVHEARNPAHVTLRLRADVPSIARTWLMQTIRSSITDSQKVEFRIVDRYVLANHLHLLTETGSALALSRGVQGSAGRLALRINRALKRTGKVFATRYHVRALTTPRDVRNTLRYVLLDRKHHDSIGAGSIRTRVRRGSIAGRSRFAGSRELVALPSRPNVRRHGSSQWDGGGMGYCASTSNRRKRSARLWTARVIHVRAFMTRRGRGPRWCASYC